MKRCIFHLPINQVTVVCVVAKDEKSAWAKLSRGEDVETLYTVPGIAKNNKPQLMTCIKLAPRKGRNKGEKNGI